MSTLYCRLCGNENSTTLIPIDSEINNNIEYYCHIVLEENKLLSQTICLECCTVLSDFVEFSEKIKETQQQLNDNLLKDLYGINENSLLNVDHLKTEKNDYSDNLSDVTEIPVKCLIGEDSKTDDQQNSSSGSGSSSSFNIPTVFVEESKTSYEETNVIEEDSYEEDEDSDFTGNDSEDSYSNKKSKIKKSPKNVQKKKKVEQSRQKSKRSSSSRNSSVKKSVSKIAVQDFENKDAPTLDIPDDQKLPDGSIATEVNLQFQNQKWSEVQMSCTECQQVQENVYQLKVHYKEHHPNLNGMEKYICTFCDPPAEISYYNKYLNHVTSTHFEYLRYCCLICPDTFWNFNALHEHYQKSHSNVRSRINMCLMCGKYFKKPYDLKEHEMSQHKIQIMREESEKPQPQAITIEKLFASELEGDLLEKQNIFSIPEIDMNSDGTVSAECDKKYEGQKWIDFSLQCSECSEEVNSSFELNNHYNTYHADLKVRTFICKDCPEAKFFSNPESYMNHIFTIHKEHLRYCCFVCSKLFWNYKALYYHYKHEHPRIKIHLCLFCGKHHKCGYDLKCHKEVHFPKSKEDEVRFYCNMCPKSYNRKHLLTRHLDYHNDVKSYVCEICGKGFCTKATLVNHKLCHSDERPYECDVCKERFKNKYKLKFHKTMHTDERPFECEICKQRFRAKGTLKGHYLTHTGERNFGCEYCEKRFAAKHDLVVHTRLHTGDYSHECQLCGERYPSWSNYSKHMKGRHQIDVRSEKKRKYDELHKKNKSDVTLEAQVKPEIPERINNFVNQSLPIQSFFNVNQFS